MVVDGGEPVHRSGLLVAIIEKYIADRNQDRCIEKVPVDRSAVAQKAVEKARDIAPKLDTALHVVSVHAGDEIVHVTSGSDQWTSTSAGGALKTDQRVTNLL